MQYFLFRCTNTTPEIALTRLAWKTILFFLIRSVQPNTQIILHAQEER